MHILYYAQFNLILLLSQFNLRILSKTTGTHSVHIAFTWNPSHAAWCNPMHGRFFYRLSFLLTPSKRYYPLSGPCYTWRSLHGTYSARVEWHWCFVRLTRSGRSGERRRHSCENESESSHLNLTRYCCMCSAFTLFVAASGPWSPAWESLRSRYSRWDSAWRRSLIKKD